MRRVFHVLMLGLMLVAADQIGLGQGAPGTPQSPDVKGTAAISGVVTDGTTQKPLQGAVVLLQPIPAPPAAGSPAQPAPIRATRQLTDEQGRFVFIDLPGSISYQITATRLGYFDGAYGRRGLAASGSTPRRISLVDGQWFRDARIELVRPSAVTGTITDEGGDPVVGVTVRVYTEIFVGGMRQLASSVADTTDDRGVYRLGNLTPGRYIVCVPSIQHAVPATMSEYQLSGTTPESVAAQEALGRPSPLRRDPAFALDPAFRLILAPNSPPPAPSTSGRPQIYPTTFYPSSRTLAEASAIQLQPGEERAAVDLQLRPVPAFRISGRLDGPPDAVGGRPLRLMIAGMEGLGRGSETATALVAGDGTFTFFNIPNGAYTLIASRSIAEYAFRSGTIGVDSPTAPGFRFMGMSSSAVFSGPAGTMFTVHTYDTKSAFQARQSVTVSGRDVTDTVVPMQSGLTMRGRFVFETSKPQATPSASSPLSLSVIAEPANGDLSLGQPRSNRNPKELSTEFTIEGLLAGAYLLRMFASQGGIVKSIMWNGRDYADTPFDTTSGRDINDVVITLTDESSTLSGTIRDRAGQTAANSAVIVFPAERAKWTNFGVQPTRIRAAPGSTTGTFTLRGLPAGDYLLVALDDELADRWKDPAFLEAASRVATRLSIAWGETKTQDLTIQEIR